MSKILLQADTFSSLTDMVDSLSKKVLRLSDKFLCPLGLTGAYPHQLTESTQSSSELVSKLSELDDLIDEEKRKWKQQVHFSINDYIMFSN